MEEVPDMRCEDARLGWWRVIDREAGAEAAARVEDHLARCASCRAEFAEARREHELLGLAFADWAAVSLPPASTGRATIVRGVPFWRRPFVLVPLAAAAALLAVWLLGPLAMSPVGPPPGGPGPGSPDVVVGRPEVAPRAPVCRVERDGATVDLDAGEGVDAGPAVLVFADGTRVTLARDARASVASAAVVRLETGALRAEVQPRPGGFAVLTAHARVEVVGTDFTVGRDPRGTTVEVTSGRVRVTPLGRVAGHMLQAGDAVRVTPDGLVEDLRAAAPVGPAVPVGPAQPDLDQPPGLPAPPSADR